MEHFVIRMEQVCTERFPEGHFDFQADSGEITAIIGDNGGGKTTLAKLLAGILPKRSGQICLGDQVLDIHSISSAHRCGIYMLQESLQIYPDKNVMDNLLLGIETLIFPHSFFTPSMAQRRTVCRAILDTLGLNLDLEQSMNRLSQGEQCLLQIGRLLLCRPKILILDEFAASLTKQETSRVMALLTELKKENICIILISHQYSTVIRHCDSVAVIEHGQNIESYSRAELGEEAFIKHVLSFKKNFAYPKLSHTPEDLLLSVSHISCGIIHDVSFSLQKGEILGIAGVVGSGRTTLIQALCKDREITAGQLFYAPTLETSGAISILPCALIEDILFSDKDLSFNITISNVRRALHHHLLSHQKLDVYARDYMDRLNIKKSSCHIPASNLSQGERQKVLIARSLHQNAKLYIFDDPSSNLDSTSRSELYNIYNALLARGASIILISSDFSELIGMCDRILLLKAGEQVGLYPAEKITTDFLYSVL